MLVLLLIHQKAGQQNSYHKVQKNVLKNLEKRLRSNYRGVKGNNKELISEAADVLFHYLVMLKSRNIKFADVLNELENRTNKSGLREKKSDHKRDDIILVQNQLS